MRIIIIDLDDDVRINRVRVRKPWLIVTGARVEPIRIEPLKIEPIRVRPIRYSRKVII